MPSFAGFQIGSPPELPPYLKSVYDLKPVIGAPKDDEVIGLHSVIRMAQKAVDIPGTGDPALVAHLSEYLFEVQMTKYQSRYLGTVFPANTIYTPPTLPIHIPIHLEPVTGAPSQEEIMKVQSATRSYQQFANAPLLFDPRVDMELSQHLFDIQMAGYTQRAGIHNRSEPHKISIPSSVDDAQQTLARESGVPTNNLGTGAGVTHPRGPVQSLSDVTIQDAIERSNQLAEQANQLIERSNRIAERANQLAEQSSRPMNQSNKLSEHFNQLFDRLNQHLDQSNHLTKESIQPVEKLGDALRNINKVLVRVQHAIVRSHKGNTISAIECLVNEKGETPAISSTTLHRTFSDLAKGGGGGLPVVIGGITQSSYIKDGWLGEFIRFYNIGEGLCDDGSSSLKPGKTNAARTRLSEYLSSCLG